MEASEQMIRYTDIPMEIHQLAADIDDFWVDFEPSDECRSEDDANLNIIYIAKDIYQGKTEMLEMLQECIDNRFLSEVAEDAKRLINRINEARAKIDKTPAR